MSFFADTSAVFKLYVEEERFAEVRALSSIWVVSHLARVEFAAGLWRKVRMGELRPVTANSIWSGFVNDWAGLGPGLHYSIVAFSDALSTRAAGLCATRRLRAYDSVQLASALVGRATGADISRFVCFDTNLNAAAAAEGFETFD